MNLKLKKKKLKNGDSLFTHHRWTSYKEGKVLPSIAIIAIISIGPIMFDITIIVLVTILYKDLEVVRVKSWMSIKKYWFFNLFMNAFF